MVLFIMVNKNILQKLWRQFVENPENKRISPAIWNLVNKLLLEKIPIAGIARVVGISESWLQNHINIIYKNVSKITGIQM